MDSYQLVTTRSNQTQLPLHQMCTFIRNFLLIIQRIPRTAHMCPLQRKPMYVIHIYNHLQINQPDGIIVLHNVT